MTVLDAVDKVLRYVSLPESNSTNVSKIQNGDNSDSEGNTKEQEHQGEKVSEEDEFPSDIEFNDSVDLSDDTDN